VVTRYWRPAPPVAITGVLPPTGLRPPLRRVHQIPAAPRALPAKVVRADLTVAAVVVHDELPREELLVHLDVALADLLVEHLDQHVARDVGREDGPRRGGGAEGPLRQ